MKATKVPSTPFPFALPLLLAWPAMHFYASNQSMFIVSETRRIAIGIAVVGVISWLVAWRWRSTYVRALVGTALGSLSASMLPATTKIFQPLFLYPDHVLWPTVTIVFAILIWLADGKLRAAITVLAVATMIALGLQWSILAPPLGLGAAVGLYVAFRLPMSVHTALVLFLNCIGIVGVSYNLYRILGASSKGTPLPSNLVEAPKFKRRNNIYHILLDSYGREDILRQYYDFKDPLSAGLRERGFQVAKGSRASYMYTTYSMASMFNLRYLETQEVLNRKQFEYLNQTIWFELLRNNKYHTESYVTLDLFMPIRNASVHKFWRSNLTHYEEELFKWMGVTKGFDAHWMSYFRERLDYVFHYMEPSASRTGTYKFFHVLSPHPPFVYGVNGEHIGNEIKFDDGASRIKSESDRIEYIRLYRDQSQFIGQKTLQHLDKIIAADPHAVILVHSDHGPRSEVDFVNQESSNFYETGSNLFAIRGIDQVPEDLVLVNSLSFVIDFLAETQLPKLPAKYFVRDVDSDEPFKEMPLISLKRRETPQTSNPANSE